MSWGADNSSRPTLKLSGDVTLASHYIENGLSQSDSSPALQGSFFFNLGPQFKVGLWGSNTNFKQSDDHFNLRGIAEVTVELSDSTNLTIAYAKSQYYNAGDRNTDLLNFALRFLKDYRILFEKSTNWEGTHQNSSRFAFGKNTQWGTNWLWNNEVGYSTPEANSLNPFFDVRSGLGRRWGVIFFEGALTATSESSQFNGAGDFFFILSAKTEL